MAWRLGIIPYEDLPPPVDTLSSIYIITILDYDYIIFHSVTDGSNTGYIIAIDPVDPPLQLHAKPAPNPNSATFQAGPLIHSQSSSTI